MNLRTLSDDEFLRYAHNQIDDLTSTDVERELLRRLEAVDLQLLLQVIENSEHTRTDLVDMIDAFEDLDFRNTIKLLKHISQSAIDTGALIELIKVMDNSAITEPAELKEEIELAKKFRGIANEVGDTFTRLTTLVTETQE